MNLTSTNMSCTSSLTYTSHEDLADSSGADIQQLKPRHRRRHSFFIPRRRSFVNYVVDGEEGILLKVDLFLTELEKRLEYLENYGECTFDAGIARTFATLQAVRERCSEVSGELIGAGRRRLQVMVETLDARYAEALAAAESMNEKARVGIELLENMLTDFETKALKMKEQSYANAADAAGSLLDGGRRVVDEGFDRAHEILDEGFERARWAREALEDHIQYAIARARERGHLKYEELPVPWRINPHILRGYRFRESKLACVMSVFGISNETVNIWSHALGLAIVLSIAFYFYPTSANFDKYTKTDVFITAIFFFAACKCLICSTIWHTMNCVADQNLMECFACVDYTGISLLIAASIMTIEYTVFYCEPLSQWFYMTTTVFLGIAGVIMPWHPTFNGQDMAWLRVAFFVGLGATGLMPVFQVLYTRGPAWALHFYMDTNLMKSVSVYTLGACVYASKVPERWFPGSFDYFGNAHNLWHVSSV